MKQSWVNDFYKEQFSMMECNHISEELYKKQMIEIRDQIGVPFYTVLELGAGSGLLADQFAKEGITVTTVELVPEIVQFAKSGNSNSVNILCGDFYTIDIQGKFDLIGYFDGFGVGTDEQQLFLLQRITNWLKDDGYALIDIYQPLYWKKINGLEMILNKKRNVLRKYSYQDNGNRMLDTWWKAECEDFAVTQSLRCYSPDEISKLCQYAGLEIVAIFPGGAMDYEKMEYHEKVGLSECLSYRIKLKKIL